MYHVFRGPPGLHGGVANASSCPNCSEAIRSSSDVSSRTRLTSRRGLAGPTSSRFRRRCLPSTSSWSRGGGAIPDLWPVDLERGAGLQAQARHHQPRLPDPAGQHRGQDDHRVTRRRDGAPPPKRQTVNCFPAPPYSSNRPLLAFAIPVADFVAVSAAAPATALTPDVLLDQARQSLPLAIAWCSLTLLRLGVVWSKIARFHVYTQDEIKLFEPIERHFKVNINSVSDIESKDRIDRIIALYVTILKIFGMGTSRMVGDPNDVNKATAPLGGFAAGGVITIGKDFANANANMQAAVLIHEAGHFADITCSHAASELPTPNGTPINDPFGLKTNPTQKNYAELNFDLSIQNAYSVAQCAMHVGSASTSVHLSRLYERRSARASHRGWAIGSCWRASSRC